MTIDDLISRLEEYRDLLGGDAEVRLATQPNYPFEAAIAGVTSGQEINEMDEEDDDDDCNDDNVVYIAEGEQLGYSSKRIWNSIT